MISTLAYTQGNWGKKLEKPDLNMGNTQFFRCLPKNKVNTEEVDNPSKLKPVACRSEKEKILFESMKYEINRLNSFKGKWPLRYVKPQDLASSGFFYLQTEDKVQCAFCQLLLHNWVIGDVPQREHIKNYPKCQFLLSKNVGNIPNKKVTSKKSFFPQMLANLNLPSSAINPAKPSMKDIRHRLLTYKFWPFKWLSPQKLAECGLYYQGVSDVVTCFYCGGSLGNWETGDDPWQEHKNFFPHCPYLSLAESVGYGLVKTKQIPHHPISDVNKSNPLREEIINKATEIFSSSVVQHTLTQLKEHKKDFTSLSELCEQILEEENNRTKSKSQGYDVCGHEIQNGMINNNHKPEFSASQVTKGETIVLQCAGGTAPAPNEQPTSDLLLCKICMDAERSVQFQPCGHFVTCQNCAERVNDCPVCRKPIYSKVRVYLS